MYCGFEPCREKVITMIILKAEVVYISYFAVKETPSSLSINSILFQHDGQNGNLCKNSCNIESILTEVFILFV